MQIPTSAQPPRREEGEQKVIFTTLSFIFILTIITRIHLTFQQHISPPTLPGWTTIHCSPKANSATNNPDFWSDIQINQNNLWRSYIYALPRLAPAWTQRSCTFDQQLWRDGWNLRVVLRRHFHLPRSPKNTCNFPSMALSGLYSGNALKTTAWTLPFSETHLKKKKKKSGTINNSLSVYDKTRAGERGIQQIREEKKWKWKC